METVLLMRSLIEPGEPGIEAALQGDRRDDRNENRRQDRHQAEKPDDSDVETGRGSPCPALPHQLAGSARRQSRGAGRSAAPLSTNTHTTTLWVGRIGRCAGEDQEGRKRGCRAPTERHRSPSQPRPVWDGSAADAVQWCPGRSRLKPREIGCLRIGTLSWGDAPTQHCGQIITAARTDQAPIRPHHHEFQVPHLLAQGVAIDAREAPPP